MSIRDYHREKVLRWKSIEVGHPNKKWPNNRFENTEKNRKFDAFYAEYETVRDTSASATQGIYMDNLKNVVKSVVSNIDFKEAFLIYALSLVE